MATTLFKLYKEMCRVLKEEPKYQNSEIKTLGEEMPNDIMFFLKRYESDLIDKERSIVAKIYFSLIDTIGSSELHKLLDKKRSMDMRLNRYSDRSITLNTVLSIFYIHGYNEHDMYRLSLKYLFSNEVEEVKMGNLSNKQIAEKYGFDNDSRGRIIIKSRSPKRKKGSDDA